VLQHIYISICFKANPRSGFHLFVKGVFSAMVSVVTDVMCFCHLRWNFVFQRPQHLMSRCAERNRVYYIEEPIFQDDNLSLQHVVCPQTGVHAVTPFLPSKTQADAVPILLQQLLTDFVRNERIKDFIAWYYTPMAIEFTSELNPKLTIYDCMDELSAFKNAPAAMLSNERKLLDQSQLIFTGGRSLYEAKASKHQEVHLFPSSVDVQHFAQARAPQQELPDQNGIPHPRLGYAGVIDERMDLNLIAYLADIRPDWQIVMLGPIVKIDPASLPRRNNIHFLGMKDYQDLPRYFSGWDVGLLPFAQNEATRFISPTKTPEYLAAGLPVVSTPIRDVERPYGELDLVYVGRTHGDFLKGIERQLSAGRSIAWQRRVNSFLGSLSWDKTWSGMERLISREVNREARLTAKAQTARIALVQPQESAARV
jgi:UDP-galactopyranose mutase